MTLPRRLARDLWNVFRRCLARKGASSEGLVILHGTPEGLRAQLLGQEIAVEFQSRVFCGSGEAHLPLEALRAVQGGGSGLVSLEGLPDGAFEARWEDEGVPQVQSFALKTASELPGFPILPTQWKSNSGALLETLAEASKVAAQDAIRFALHRVQLRGRSGSVVATDGRQLLVVSGFAFSWEHDVLIPVNPVVRAPELGGHEEILVGGTEDHVVLRTGLWTVCFRLDRSSRFPSVDSIIPRATGNEVSLNLAPEDAAFLVQTLPRLPGKDDDARPVTVDLNGHVCVRARATDQAQTTEVVLSRSSYTGKPVRFACNREFLIRAAQMGLADAQIQDADHPIAFRNTNRLYLFMPLHSKTAIAPVEGMTRLESDTVTQAPSRRTRPVEPKIETPEQTPTKKPRSVRTQKSDGSTGLISEAQALRDQLREGYRRANELLRSVKRHRRQSHLVNSTLASLRQLQTIGG